MLKIFRKNRRIFDILKRIEKDFLKGKKSFTFVIYGKHQSVDLEVVTRSSLNYFGKKYNQKFGFVIVLFFNKNKVKNDEFLSKFKANKYFNIFNYIFKDDNDYYYLDCENDILKTEEICLEILKNVFDDDLNDVKINLF